MKSLYDEKEASKFKTDLDLRVYTSRVLGRDASLVLHGGGNTSVKSRATNFFGESEEILYVKGSGWDLATIEAEGFAPVKMEMLLKMAELKELSDTDMVKYQRLAMTNPSAPNPSVEAILHAIIPFKFVDHTHTDAVVTITNTKDGEARIKELYGDKVLVIPYIMPGFVLAKLIYEMTRDVNWSELEGMVLMNHGLFTFSDDAKKSYEKTIELVDKAEKYLQMSGATLEVEKAASHVELLTLAKMRREVSNLKGKATISILNEGDLAIKFSKKNIENIATQGPLTPDHVIRTKRVPAILGDDYVTDLANYVKEYKKYFDDNKKDETLLNPAPNFAILKGKGSLSFGVNAKEANIIKDINNHTYEAILKAEKLGGYKALSASSIFEVEYWSLEQAKLQGGGSVPEFSGKVALVTGAASGIGLAIAKMLNKRGAAVVALDINPEVENIFSKIDAIGVKCDLTSSEDIQHAISCAVKSFGGIDIVVSNAGIFTPSQNLDVLSDENWQKSMDINLTSHQKLIKYTAPFLKLGVDACIIMVASKNFHAPGKGAAAYSVAKAGQTQLARIAALELGEYGVRVNTLHPHAVFDTAIWTEEVLKNRAKAYNMSVQEYKTNNVLKTDIKSDDVAELVCAMAGKAFAKTTGSQVAIDGGSDRTI
ncbi:bifunctional aldolase/short-chain dehydrogenase [Sulfurimonas sp.]|jgi:rhamnose utilization protein RhaD (predicted bifunctional aldolase and dehydrogenase)/NAD(P)-dependent dehydrogenase (short-subunit alcohol dehydrogenase family)|uniref:bifunctional aldolase/short-chain dehydrogenase n=1 Tax=Sulfurimonas sp. TaxID=2022749 RepID=UPI0025FA6362|nr:bifunctional aldolase/short-chain dehydrogenase [Sulfurimonas sp.]MCK9472165.1 bifunctional aldolase/short-chain dehydrogenase [Sulfurimonas sp.]MDD3506517.1 bifunctional aldolase/short-chain dehydrogenase [Sulfurimonas sp.]